MHRWRNACLSGIPASVRADARAVQIPQLVTLLAFLCAITAAMWTKQHQMARNPHCPANNSWAMRIIPIGASAHRQSIVRLILAWNCIEHPKQAVRLVIRTGRKKQRLRT